MFQSRGIQVDQQSEIFSLQGNGLTAGIQGRVRESRREGIDYFHDSKMSWNSQQQSRSITETELTECR